MDFPDIYSEFQDFRPDFEALYTEMDGFNEDKLEDALSYMRHFYEVIGSERQAQRRIEETCRKT